MSRVKVVDGAGGGYSETDIGYFRLFAVDVVIVAIL